MKIAMPRLPMIFIMIWLIGSWFTWLLNWLYGDGFFIEHRINITNTSSWEVELTTSRQNKATEITILSRGQTKAITLIWWESKQGADFRIKKQGMELITFSELVKKRKESENLKIDTSYTWRTECDVFPLLRCAEITVVKHDIEVID